MHIYFILPDHLLPNKLVLNIKENSLGHLLLDLKSGPNDVESIILSVYSIPIW